MGEYHQIEVYPPNRVNSTQLFIDFLRKSLNSLTHDSLIVDDFVESVQLIFDEEHPYFSFDQTIIKASKIINHPLLSWTVDVFYWPNQQKKYELRLGILSNSFTEYSANMWPQYNPETVETIIEAMNVLHGINYESLILFTDEASEGVFLEFLNTGKHDINYLFEIGIIPTEIKVDLEKKNYIVTQEMTEYKMYISKSNYMEKYNGKSN